MSRQPVVVVTGAAAGVGRATAHRFAEAGCAIGLLARDASALEDVRSEVEALGGSALCLPVDMADADAVFAAAERVERELGPIEVWVNVAMVTVFSPVVRMTPEEFRRVIEVTFLGYVHGTMAALKHMRPRDSGVIVQTGSALAYRGIPLQAAYCSAKHAIRGFTSSLRAELDHEKSGVRMTIVELPAVNTPQFDWARSHMRHQPRPLAPVVQPEVAADALFEASRRPAREYWLGRMTIMTILGNMLLPGVMDRMMATTAFKGQQRRQLTGPDRQDNLMEPVHGGHATRGAFSREAENSAWLVEGPDARLMAAAAGGLVFALAGAALASSLRRRRRS